MDAIQQMPQEIIGLIIPCLSKHDLAIATRVCSSWHDLFSPFLWRTVHIDTANSLKRFMPAVLEGALIRNGHHIRILDVRYYDAVEQFAKLGRTCTGLLELTIDSKETPVFTPSPGFGFRASFGSMGSSTAFGSTAPSGAAFGSSTPSVTAFGSSTPSVTAFGSTAPSGSSTAFGSTTPSGSSTAFGSTATSGSSTTFGSTAPSGSCTAFGSTAPSGSSTAFGSTATSGSSTAFGSTATSGSCTAFGSTAPSGSSTAFGSTAISGSSTAFGSTVPSGFGATFGSTTSSSGTSSSSGTTPTFGFGAPLTTITTPTTAASSAQPTAASFGAAPSPNYVPSSPFISPASSFGAEVPVTTSAFNRTLTPAAPSSSTITTFGPGGINPFSLSSYGGRVNSTVTAEDKAESYRSYLALILQRNKWLRSLTVKRYTANRGIAHTTDFERVLRSLPDSIESLILCPSVFGSHGWTNCPDTTQPVMPYGQPLTHLRTLQVSVAVTTHTLCGLLSRCVALEELRMGDTCYFSIGMIAETTRKHCPLLTELFLNDSVIPDRDLADLLTASTAGWKSLGLGKISQLGPLVVDQILKSAPSLRNLWINGGTSFRSQDIQTLLRNAPHLTRLCALDEHQGAYGSDIFLTAKDMLSSEWACCESLEILELEIRGVPRPEHTVRTNGRPFSQEERHDMSKDYPKIRQEMIYERLGQLKNLRMLVLGHDEVMDGSNYGLFYVDKHSEGEFSNDRYIQIGYQYDCLDMSLASGLDRMHGLKELRRVGVERMAVQFYNADEQAWARKVWPKFGQAVNDTFWEDRCYVSR